MNSRIQSLDLD